MSRRSIIITLVVAAVALVAVGLATMLLSTRSAPQGGYAEQGAQGQSAPSAPSAPSAAPAEASEPSGGAEKANDVGVRPRAGNVAQPPARVMKDGVNRIGCAWACAREDECRLRDGALCMTSSCEATGDVRIPTTMDHCVVDADTCLDAVVCSCAESCWKRGECAGDHDNDDECARSCRVLARQQPARVYADNRCVLEHRCGDIAVCGG